MSARFTPSQALAISLRGGSVLVSAAAGAGKTSVLVERIVSLLCDEQSPADPASLLVVTFTNAAAGEMAARARRRLDELVAADPSNAFLRAQRRRFNRAQISTIHSFCSSLLREHFGELAIPPDFTIADNARAADMRGSALESALAALYADEVSGIESLSDLFGRSRTDAVTARLIEKTYDFELSLPYPKRWESECLAELEAGAPFNESRLAPVFYGFAEEALTSARLSLLEALERCSDDSALEQNYSPALESDLEHVSSVAAHIDARDWDGAYRALRAYIRPRLGGGTRGCDINAREAAKGLRASAHAALDKLTERCLAFTTEDYAADCALMLESMRALFGAVARFSEELMALKREKRCFEFGDLERLSLELLSDENGEPTAAAREAAAAYSHILIDEYQDTSGLQDAIFRLISRGGKNLFLVGDIKQSVYSFRRAEPEIFAEKAREYHPVETGLLPAKISLRENFRSSRAVLDACNAVFEPLMSESVGGTDYAAEGGLAAPETAPPGDGAGLELLLLEGSEEDEAAAAAALIAKMLREGYEIEDKGERRRCRAEDFCILLRSTKDSARVYERALENAGVRGWTDGAGDLFSCSEVQVALALLRVADNPRRDVELTSAMLSPLFGFTADELLALRSQDRSAPLSSLVWAQDGEKFARFKEAVGRIRDVAASSGAGRAVRECIDGLDADALLCAGPEYSARRDNLRELMAIADSLENSSDDSLAGFLRLCERAAKGGSVAARAFSPPRGAVCVTSIHKSKGLEWPIVFFSNSGRRFNRADSRDDALLLDTGLGLGARVKLPCEDGLAMYAHKTAHYLALSLLAERRSAGEELRLMYVALTRARHKIFVTGRLDNMQKSLPALAASVARGAPSPYEVASAASPLHRLLAAMFCRIGASAAEAVLSGETHSEYPFAIRALETGAPAENAIGEAVEPPLITPDASLVGELKRRFAFEPASVPLSLVPSKLAVTALAEKGAGGVLYKPAFARKGLTAAERGTAIHRFMQSADYAAAARSVKVELERLIKAEYLSERDASGVDTLALERLFASGLGKRLASEKTLRELEFIDFVRAGDVAELPATLADERVLVQGIADCVLLEEGGATLVDYKSDRVSEPGELIERYSAQLSLYKRALERRLAMPVRRCVIYSFALAREIELEL